MKTKYFLIILLATTISIAACKKDNSLNELASARSSDDASLYYSGSNDAYSSTFTSVVINERFEFSQDQINILEYGICHGPLISPEFGRDAIVSGNRGQVVYIIDNLPPNSTVYVRPYVLTPAGPVYGEEIAVKTGALENSVWECNLVLSPDMISTSRKNSSLGNLGKTQRASREVSGKLSVCEEGYLSFQSRERTLRQMVSNRPFRAHKDYISFTLHSEDGYELTFSGKIVENTIYGSFLSPGDKTESKWEAKADAREKELSINCMSL